MAANVLKVRDENGDWQPIPAIKGDVGPQGEQGVSGVYVGGDVPPDGYDVWVRPEGEANEMWPVNSIYLSVSNTNPAEMFGGTWVSFGTGRVLVGVDEGQAEFADVEQEGGEKTHALTVGEMPSHTHVWSTGAGTNYNVGQAANPAAQYASGTSNAGFKFTGANAKTGGDETHNNLQPYITCYMWKRTA